MKKWEAPEVSHLEVDKTKTVGGAYCDCGVIPTAYKQDGTKQHHYCHKHGNNGGFVNGNQNGHDASVGCTMEHKNDKGEVVPCCCFNASEQPDSSQFS